MKVAMVSPYDLSVPGGVQSHVAHLAVALRAHGDDVVVIGPGGGPGQIDVGGSVGLPFNGSVAPIGLGPNVARNVARALRAAEPDVVHVHEPLVPWVGLAAVRSAPAPIVGTFHAWSDRARLYRLARRVGRGVLQRLAVRVAVSPAAAEYHAGALGVAPSTFTIVPNGVEVARFSGAKPLGDVHEPQRPTLLFVGRLERRKGLEPMIRAFTRLKTDRPELRLLVVGEGPERERCEALLPARLRSDVRFLGRVSQDELPGCFAAADLYVSPALGGESFGIVLLEAMAAGRAVVASDIPGYRTVLRDGVQGRLVTPDDPRALAGAIGVLLDNAALRAAMASEGRSTVADYDWPVVARRLRELYASVA